MPEGIVQNVRSTEKIYETAKRFAAEHRAREDKFGSGYDGESELLTAMGVLYWVLGNGESELGDEMFIDHMNMVRDDW